MEIERNSMRMQNKRPSQSLRVALVASVLLGAIALFPPRQQTNKAVPQSVGRGFLFNPEFSSTTIPTSNGGRVEIYEINAGRLLAEALLIVAVAGFAMVWVWSEDA